jgi:hypothetical protein
MDSCRLRAADARPRRSRRCGLSGAVLFRIDSAGYFWCESTPDASEPRAIDRACRRCRRRREARRHGRGGRRPSLGRARASGEPASEAVPARPVRTRAQTAPRGRRPLGQHTARSRWRHQAATCAGDAEGGTWRSRVPLPRTGGLSRHAVIPRLVPRAARETAVLWSIARRRVSIGGARRAAARRCTPRAVSREGREAEACAGQGTAATVRRRQQRLPAAAGSCEGPPLAATGGRSAVAGRQHVTDSLAHTRSPVTLCTAHSRRRHAGPAQCRIS